MDSPESRQNIMELLVEEEANRQVRLLPRSLKAFLKAALKLTEIVAHALHRLPSLYVSSREGIGAQLHRLRLEFGARVKKVVQAAIWVVQQTPHYLASPLQCPLSSKKPIALNQQLRCRKVQTFAQPTAQQVVTAAQQADLALECKRLLRKAEPAANVVCSGWDCAFCC